MTVRQVASMSALQFFIHLAIVHLTCVGALAGEISSRAVGCFQSPEPVSCCQKPTDTSSRTGRCCGCCQSSLSKSRQQSGLPKLLCVCAESQDLPALPRQRGSSSPLRIFGWSPTVSALVLSNANPPISSVFSETSFDSRSCDVRVRKCVWQI